MKKNFLSIAAVVMAVLLVAFTQQPEEKQVDTRYFQYTEDDLSFASLTNPANWTETSFPATGCESGSIPCLVRVVSLIDYEGDYSNGIIDHVDFARFLELKEDGAAQNYVTGDNMLESKE